MHIAIIGTGNVGATLGRQWALAGHNVTFGTRNPDKAENRALTALGNVKITDSRAAAAGADVVVLAVPWGSVAGVLAQLGDLSGKVLVDCTNPLGSGLSLDTSHGFESGASYIASLAPGARVVKAFNSTGAANMADPHIGGVPLAMFLCGDDAGANSTVATLAEDLGFHAIDNGGLSQARHLESLALIWITQAYKQGWGPEFGMAVLRR